MSIIYWNETRKKSIFNPPVLYFSLSDCNDILKYCFDIKKKMETHENLSTHTQEIQAKEFEEATEHYYIAFQMITHVSSGDNKDIQDTTSKLSSKYAKRKNKNKKKTHTDISFYQIRSPKLHENILKFDGLNQFKEIAIIHRLNLSFALCKPG